MLSKARKAAYPQCAGWAFARAARLLLCVVDVGEDLLTTLQISRAGRREGKTSRRTVEQAGSQLVFEF
jgi:hypothetical protein